MPVVPDDYHTKDYEAIHRTKGTTLIVDNGQYTLTVLPVLMVALILEIVELITLMYWVMYWVNS